MRILWLKTELLHPVDKGGRIRTYHMLKELKRNHNITYLTLDDGTAAPDSRARATEYCHELIAIPHRTRAKFTPGFYVDLTRNLLTRLPYFIMKYKSQQMRDEIEKRTAEGSFDVVVCDFLMASVNLPARIACATVLFEHNVEAMIWKRHYEVQRNPLKKLYLYRQWRKAFAFEQEMCRRFDQVVAVSREDCELLQRNYGIASVADVPTGVDTAFFQPSAAASSDPYNVVFTGSMDWLPNEDAMQYFIKEIMPQIRQAVPEVKLTVVGRNPYASLLEISRRDVSVVVTGAVDDVRPYMAGAAAYVVPLRIGGGTRLKIFEAMAMGMPLVSTTVGAEGLPVTDGKELILADTPQDFSMAVVRILKNKNLARELGARAARLVQGQFGWDQAAQKFDQLCVGAIEAKARTSEEKIAMNENAEALV